MSMTLLFGMRYVNTATQWLHWQFLVVSRKKRNILSYWRKCWDLAYPFNQTYILEEEENEKKSIWFSIETMISTSIEFESVINVSVIFYWMSKCFGRFYYISIYIKTRKPICSTYPILIIVIFCKNQIVKYINKSLWRY